MRFPMRSTVPTPLHSRSILHLPPFFTSICPRLVAICRGPHPRCACPRHQERQWWALVGCWCRSCPLSPSLFLLLPLPFPHHTCAIAPHARPIPPPPACLPADPFGNEPRTQPCFSCDRPQPQDASDARVPKPHPPRQPRATPLHPRRAPLAPLFPAPSPLAHLACPPLSLPPRPCLPHFEF